MSFDPDLFTIPASRPIRDAVERIDRNRKGIVLVTDDDQRLAGTVVDGDVRRAILDGVDLDAPVGVLLKRKEGSRYEDPVTAPPDATREELRGIMRTHQVRQVPVVDGEERVVDLVTMDDLVAESALPVHAVVMAGGFGTRLRPLTDDTPKPMLPVGEKPLLERIVEQLRNAGIRRLTLTTHYRPEAIREHFGDGARWGMRIDYVHEEEPLDTAGALGLLDPDHDTLLVMNGDILTNLNHRDMVHFHHEHDAAMTIGVHQYEVNVPYGVVEADGVDVTQVNEKPKFRFFINGGVYTLGPSAHDRIPQGEPTSMTNLIDELLADDERVVSFPIHEYWLDIGQPQDYERAQQDVESGKLR